MMQRRLDHTLDTIDIGAVKKVMRFILLVLVAGYYGLQIRRARVLLEAAEARNPILKAVRTGVMPPGMHEYQHQEL